jgi:glycosyltransferase involved in cell wall biosynthesis
MHSDVTLLQDGARGHYGLALALQRAGILKRIYTDFYAPPGSAQGVIARLLQRVKPAIAKRMLERHSPGLDRRLIRQNFSLMLKLRLREKQFDNRVRYFQWAAEETAKWVMKTERDYSGLMIGFVRNIHPALCRHCRGKGMPVIGDQMIAPAATEMMEDAVQQANWPGWEDRGGDNAEEYQLVNAFERETWNAANHLIAPSDYVKGELVRHGVAAEKVTVVNYAVDDSVFRPVDRSGREDKPITIGFMGTVCLRKGIQFFNEMAKRFRGDRRVRFVAVGPLQITEIAANRVRENVEVVGKVPRSESLKWFSDFDIFYFPTTCEGSAYVLMEAMATGLPIVTSPNSGTVARNHQECFVARYDDLDAHAAYLERLIADRDLRLAMGEAAATYYKRFDINSYSSRLYDVVHNVAVEL